MPTVRSVEASCDFYRRVLGMERLDQPDRPTALLFGSQKVDLHEVGRIVEPKARTPTQGSSDFCLVAAVPLAEVQASLQANGVAIKVGPVERTRARGAG